MDFSPQPSTKPYAATGTSRIPRDKRNAPKTSVPEPILIAVLGVTGAGKSSFINTATGTKHIAAVRMRVDGRDVTLIDTPGFDDTNMTDGEVLSIIAEWLRTMYEYQKLLTGIILLQPVDGNRAYGSEARRTRLFREICGKDTYENVVIATTMWSKLRNRSEGEDRVMQRQTSGDFWANLVNNGQGKSARLVEYQDSKDSALDIIRMLMDHNKKPLQLQVELCEADGRLFDTTAGQQVDADLSVATAAKKQRLHAYEMSQFREKYTEEMEKLRKEIESLRQQKAMIQEKKVHIIDRVPPWISALAAGASVAVGVGAIFIPLAASGACCVM